MLPDEIDFKSIIERMQDIYYCTDADGKILYISPAIKTMLGYSPDEVIGRGVEEFYINPKEREKKILQLKNDDRSHKIISALRHKNNSTVWGAATSQNRYNADGSYGGVEGILRDVSDEILLREQLTVKKEQLHMILETSPAGTVYFDTDSVVVDCNKAALDIFGATRAQLCGMNLLEKLNNMKLKDAVAKVLKEGNAEFQDYYTSVLGSRQSYLDVKLVAIRDDEGNITSAVGLFMDRMKEKQALLQLQHQSMYDTLTNIPNRILLEDHIQSSIRHAETEGESFALIFMDLDNFKWINDSFGHTVGDKLLIQSIGRIQKILKKRDFIARFGGDEFVMVLDPIYDYASLQSIAQRVLDTFLEPFSINDAPYYLTASIGISIYPEHASTSETLISAADAAMYRAKNEGRNRYYFFTEQINADIEERMHIENDLRKALKDNQFMLLYQPQIDTKNKEVVGLEALIRWIHPKYGVITPDRFITIAENNHLIIPMTQWILNQTCQQAKEWLDEGIFRGQVSINISGIHIQYGDLMADITKALDHSGLPAKQLMLEITESRLMHHEKKGKELFTALKQTGVDMAIDDFGTGYSSLSYLHTFPFSLLKIDKSFIGALNKGHETERLADMIIMLSKSLNIQVIAEGVETKEQLIWLQQHGCHLVQGYLYAKPMPADHIKTFFTTQAELLS